MDKRQFYKRLNQPKAKPELSQLGAELDPSEKFIICKAADFLIRCISPACLIEITCYDVLNWILGRDVQELCLFMADKLSTQDIERWKNKLSGIRPDTFVCSEVFQHIKHADVPAVISFVKDALKGRIEKLSSEQPSELELKLQSIQQLFNLQPLEVDFCLFAFIISANDDFARLMKADLHCVKYANRNLLAKILGVRKHELIDMLNGTLCKCRLCTVDTNDIEMDDGLFKYLCGVSKDYCPEALFKKVESDVIPLSCHSFVNPQCTEHVLRLLKTQQNSATHILLYGSPGTGKTSYARGIGKELGVPTYETVQSNKISDRWAGIIACLNMTNTGDGSLVIIDEADNLLNTKHAFFERGESPDKGWLNHLLENPKVRMIWVTNRIDHVEESVLRRFAFSIQFKPFNRKQRAMLWETILDRYESKGCLSDEQIREVSKRYDVNAGIIDMAVKKACETPCGSLEGFYSAVKLGVESHHILIKGTETTAAKENEVEAEYSLEGLNIDGDISGLIANLEMFDQHIRASKNTPLVAGINLLFYGPPGTGKSELARFIASQLDREPIFKRASDFLHPYVGMTERLIADAFKEAEDEEALLVVDEADSFIFSREKAVRSWEVSHVNEFLTRMEKFRGILICTTNRYADLDSASMRRFCHKVGFNYLQPEGNVIFYNKMLMPLVNEPLDRLGEQRIKNLKHLAPGDFKIVRNNFILLPQAQRFHTALINELSSEAKLKDINCMKSAIGFN